LNQVPFTIAGIAPTRFFGTEIGMSPDFYVPISMEPRLRPGSDALQTGTTWWVKIMGRLRPGVSREQAKANLNQLFPEFLRETVAHFPPGITQSMKGKFLQETIDVFAGSQGFSNLRRKFSQPLLVLMTAVGMVLLITCANIANLLLARSVVRRREIALRVALGASRTRILRQLLIESLLLAAMGGTSGLILGQWGERLFLTLVSKPAVPLEVHTDARVICFTGAICVLCGILFGVLPAYRAAVASRSGKLRAGKTLVLTQVALSTLLLVAAGLFVRTLAKLESLDTGFTSDRVLVFTVSPGLSGYSGSRLLNYYRELAARLRTIPGILSVSFSFSSPVSGNESTTMISEFGVSATVHENSRSFRNMISPGFFTTLGIRILAGRDFVEQDSSSTPKLAVINESFAREHFGAQSPLGKKLGYGPSQRSGPVMIVGVVKDSKYNSLREENTPMVYLPYTQYPDLNAMTFELRAPIGLTPLSHAIRQSVGRDVAITDLTTLEEQIRDSLLQDRLVATLTSFFGLLALLLATIGLFGLMHYAIARRINEIGVRMALGAQRRDVLGMVLREAALLAGGGLMIGIAASFGLVRMISSMLFGVASGDSLTLIGASGLLIGAALIASYLPARRASRVDPMVALRYE
jgi:predicted permease